VYTMGPCTNETVAVHIAELETPAPDDSLQKKQYSAGIAKRLSGRLSVPNSSSRSSMASQNSTEGPSVAASPAVVADDSQAHQAYHHRQIDHASKKLLAQVADWLEHERTKKVTRKGKSTRARRKSPPEDAENGTVSQSARPRASSVDSSSSDISFDRLQRIVEDGMAALGCNSIPKFSPRLGRKPSHRKSHKSMSIHRTASSDTDYIEGDVVVPSCDVFLDNSKTLSWGLKTPVFGPVLSSRKEEKEKQAWTVFKNEIVRLAHTLRLKGWRRVPLDSGESISVERLSGALTNAVYVVSPPANLPSTPELGKKAPEKVLLRIYGPQVEHLIDRKNELSVLQRLARKKIGPRLLGTFTNGRFEQFFNATTLTTANLREPETSRQIAKRMRELHDGVQLLEAEKDAGPGVWKNWDRWVDQVEKTTLYMDKQVLSGAFGSEQQSRGLVCGVEWPVFRAMVEKHRAYLCEHYGNAQNIREKLVFAHNDVSCPMQFLTPREC
jgi:choline kinase